MKQRKKEKFGRVPRRWNSDAHLPDRTHHGSHGEALPAYTVTCPVVLAELDDEARDPLFGFWDESQSDYVYRDEGQSWRESFVKANS